MKRSASWAKVMNYPAASSGVSLYNKFFKTYAASGGVLDPRLRNKSGDIWDGICTIPAVRDILW
jgi:hypothetical protein